MKKFYTDAELQETRLTVGDLADTMYPTETFDTALPQGWVDAMYERGFDVRGHFVTLYPTGGVPYMAPITQTGIRMAAIVASSSA